MAGDSSVGWSDDIECEDGPLLVANADDFAHWFGSAEDPGYEAVQQFAPGRACYLWRVSPGSVRIGVDSSRTSLVLAQIEYADGDASRATALAHALAYTGEQDAPGLRYRIGKGPVVISWAGNSVQDSSTDVGRLPLSGATPGALIDFAGGPNAAAVWLAPGLYVSSLFIHEDDRWGVSWSRLQRVSD